MTPDRYRPVDTDEVLRRVDTHARVGAALLGGLGEAGGDEDDEEFVSELVTAARNAAEHELADVAFDLARACLAAHEACSKDVIWVEEPRDPEEILAALQVLSHRLGPVERPPLDIKPGTESDVRPLLSALALCERLEGRSERVLHLEAHVPAIHEQWDEVDRRATALATSTTKPNWIRSALLLKALANIRRSDGQEALATLRQVRSDFGDDRILLSNLCCAHALLGDRAEFRAAAHRFAQSQMDTTKGYDWSASIRSSLPWFASHLGESTAFVAAAFGLEHRE